MGKSAAGGSQELSLDDECVNLKTVKHELMHAMGFWHEHQRSDRDEHVLIHVDNITPGNLVNLIYG